MIDYTTLGANDFDKSARINDELLSLVGITRIMEMDGFIMWGNSLDDSMLAQAKPYDGNEATVGNGVMVAIRAESQAQVDAIYNKAIERDGTDEGEPGSRGGGIYAGYFRDLDGSKLNASIMG